MDFEQQLKEIERLNLSNPYPSLAARLNFQGVHDIGGVGHDQKCLGTCGPGTPLPKVPQCLKMPICSTFCPRPCKPGWEQGAGWAGLPFGGLRSLQLKESPGACEHEL